MIQPRRHLCALLIAGAIPAGALAVPHLAIAQISPTQAGAQDVPRVPRFPLGREPDGSAAWDRLAPACKGTLLRDIQPCLQSFVEYGSLQGAVTLVDRRGWPVQVDGFGAYRADAIVQIQSLTKPFLSILVLKLVEQGRIPSVETRVIDLPGFSDFPYREVTIRQLLTHTSGVWYRQEPQRGVRTGIAPQLTNRFEKTPSITARDKPLREVAAHYANAALYPLGSTAPQYSNIGFTFLGWIVERMSGSTVDAYMKQVIFDPLGLHDTFFFPDSATPDQRRRIVDLDRRLPDPSDYNHYDKLRPGWRYVSPEGGLYATAADLRTFLSLFRHRGQVPGHERVLSEASIAQMMNDQATVAHRCNGQQGRSLGFYVTRQGGCPDLPGLSEGTLWHQGRFSTEFWYDPLRDEIGMFLAQVVMENDIYTASLAERDIFHQMLSRITGR